MIPGPLDECYVVLHYDTDAIQYHEMQFTALYR